MVEVDIMVWSHNEKDRKQNGKSSLLKLKPQRRGLWCLSGKRWIDVLKKDLRCITPILQLSQQTYIDRYI